MKRKNPRVRQSAPGDMAIIPLSLEAWMILYDEWLVYKRSSELAKGFAPSFNAGGGESIFS